MNKKNLSDELLEDDELDKKIIKSFKSKNSLPKNIFHKIDNEYVMVTPVREKLLEISDNFINFIGVDLFVYDICLTGSLSNFNWSEFSDVDLHIIIDFDDLGSTTETMSNIIKDFFESKKKIWNDKYDIKIKGFDVEIYIQDINEKHVSSGVYSILNNQWVIEPNKTQPKIDDSLILEKGLEYGKKIDLLYKKSIKGIDVSDDVLDLKSKIKKFRQSGLESGGEYSYENLTFKLLRRNDYIKKLHSIKTIIRNKKMSLTQ